jgi:hypothetical protein
MVFIMIKLRGCSVAYEAILPEPNGIKVCQDFSLSANNASV